MLGVTMKITILGVQFQVDLMLSHSRKYNKYKAH